MLGINTVIKDDPLLNVRTINGNIKNPIRIVVDSKARISLEAKIINSPEIAPTIIAVTNKAPDEKLNHLEEKGVRVIVCPEKNTRVNLRFLMQELAKQNIDSILLEGGGTMNFEAIHQGIVDKVIVFIAPKIIGGAEAITPVEGMGVSCLVNAVKLENLKTIQSGQDIMVEGYIKKK
jgi:diaminohydroxyphosphoribosylaminopyrimidine deaminase/5-amino-6-(5-phosphoribosylamino)uracil reductase